ncbi:uncharacterized protein LOC123473996 [Daphnia magna]|uniref:uncharacterized protein LOC123473996 n=1 Tax=Daphnia magna TaxID=35525 RepID=UPI001E1BC931|nr:uncharacterized protein LOC123473996 [Daphnia magna]
MAEHVAQDFNSLRAVSHVPKFDSTNHREWNYEIHLCFQAMEVDCVVLGTELCPAEERNEENLLLNEAAIRQWTRKDVLARNCIMATITKEMKENLYICVNATQMWKKAEPTVSTANRRASTPTLAELLRL